MNLFKKKNKEVSWQEKVAELTNEIGECNKRIASYNRLSNLYSSQNSKVLEGLNANKNNKQMVENYKAILKVNLYKDYMFKLFKQYNELGKMKLENEKSELIVCQGKKPFDNQAIDVLKRSFLNAENFSQVAEASTNLDELQNAMAQFVEVTNINIDPNIESQVDEELDSLLSKSIDNKDTSSKKESNDIPSEVFKDILSKE